MTVLATLCVGLLMATASVSASNAVSTQAEDGVSKNAEKCNPCCCENARAAVAQVANAQAAVANKLAF